MPRGLDGSPGVPSRQGGQRWRRKHMACVCVCVCSAALLSLDNKACVHYHIYRMVLKRLPLRQRSGDGEKEQPSQIQSALREMKRDAGYTVCYENTQPGVGMGEGAGGGGVGARWSNISWPHTSEIYCDLNSWPASEPRREISFGVSLHNLRRHRRGAGLKTFIILILFQVDDIGRMFLHGVWRKGNETGRRVSTGDSFKSKI